MFKTLNRFISRLDSDPIPQASRSLGPGDNSYGFQVLRNTNPDLQIEPWFDFIIGINGHLLDSPDPHLFATEVRNCAGSSLSLNLWTAKGQRTYSLTVSVPLVPESLSLSLQLAPLNSTQNIWHILSIPSPLSPAYLAGLLPHSDYILGSPSGTLRGEAALGELVEDHLNRSLVLWVYNSEFDVVREVEIVPRRGWGGEGALGAVLGFGALHRLPVGLGEEVQAPGEKLFDGGIGEERGSSESYNRGDSGYYPGSAGPYLAPAELPALQPSQHQQQQQQQFSFPTPPPMLSPSAPAPPQQQPPLMSPNAPLPPYLYSNTPPLPAAAQRHGKKARPTHHGAGNASPNNHAFEDMFEEGTKKSLEQDYVPSRKVTPLAPPPKIGGAGGPPPRRGPSPLQQQSQPATAAPPPALTVEDEQEDVGEPGDAELT